MKLRTEILKPEASRLIAELKEIEILESFYLAGGTALALQIGHRESIDFDFFTQTDFQVNPSQVFGELGELTVIANTENYCELILDGVKVMLMSYFYPRAQNHLIVDRLKLATILDIGLMKITALEGRMNWKDIIDLYFIDKQIGLETVIAKYLEIFPQQSMNQYSQLKILLDVGEIDKSPKPKMLQEVDYSSASELVFSKLLRGFGSRVKLDRGR